MPTEREVAAISSSQRAPRPSPTQIGNRKLNAQTLMLGDSDNDILAARDAGCPVWCVPYGYNEGRPAETLACDRIVASLAEVAVLLGPGPLRRLPRPG